MHNSNRQLQQVTLSGEILAQENGFYVIGFVPACVVRLEEDVWFRKLSSEQADSVESFLSGAWAE